MKTTFKFTKITKKFTINNNAFLNRTTAIFRQPSLSSVHNILLLPFTVGVWLGVCATLCVFVLILVFLMRVNNYLVEKKYGTLNIPEIVTLVHGAICQQGEFNYHTLQSRNHAGKILISRE